jgi:micrococcal nuclease
MKIEAIIFLLSAAVVLPGIGVADHDLRGKVVGVPDGDSLSVLLDGQGNMENKTTSRVRLFGVDTPEKSQAFGERARTYTSKQCLNRNVVLKVVDRDQYGRLVADAYVESDRGNPRNDIHLQEQLVKNGFAWVYRQYSRSPHLIELESKARKQRLGLWSDEHPIPPWEYRRGSRSTTLTMRGKTEGKSPKQNRGKASEPSGWGSILEFFLLD